MPETQWQEEVGRRVPTIQIIVAVLVMGSFTFLVVAIVIVQRGVIEPLDEGPPIITYVAFLFAAAEFLAWLIVPRLMVTRARQAIAKGTWQMPSRQGTPAHLSRFPEQTSHADKLLVVFLEETGDAGRLLVAFQTKTIIASALFEGVAFLAMIAYMLEHSPLALVLAILMVIGVAAHFPTRSGVVHWIEDQLRLIEQERQFGR